MPSEKCDPFFVTLLPRHGNPRAPNRSPPVSMIKESQKVPQYDAIGATSVLHALSTSNGFYKESTTLGTLAGI